MTIETHPFDDLRRWASLSDSELAHAVSKKALDEIVKIVDLLGSEGLENIGPPDASTFVKYVRIMDVRLKTGSHRLSEAILKASEHVDIGQLDEAKKIYEHFIDTISSPFYRRIAEFQLRKLDKI